VVLPRRSVVGSCSRASANAVFSLAIAPAVALALETRFARSSRRSARAVTSPEDSTMKRVSDSWSEFASLTRRDVLCRNGLK
jgi:hypothetical protein